jgi:hypothetical protein
MLLKFAFLYIKLSESTFDGVDLGVQRAQNPQFPVALHVFLWQMVEIPKKL